MLLGRYTFSLVFDDDAILPEYKGSTFRGIFGHSLKKVVCALKRQECSGCLLREKCVYYQVFELQAEAVRGQDGKENADMKPRKRIVAPPHPYVIEPPDDSRSRYARGECIDFNLLLFGEANGYLPWFIYAFNEMGVSGVGKAVNGRRASFHLDRVTASGQTVFDGGGKEIRKGAFTEDLSLTQPDSRSPVSSSLTIRLKTPLRLKFENHLNAEPPFHLLVRAMLRRVSSLEDAFGAGEPALDYRGLVRRAGDVSITSSSIRWFDWKRYSNRQDQAMLMGGVIGDITFKGNLEEFIPLIRYCEQVHLGKGTTFGLGRIAVVPVEKGVR